MVSGIKKKKVCFKHFHRFSEFDNLPFILQLNDAQSIKWHLIKSTLVQLAMS